MNKKSLYKIINEEISEFDFLNMDNIKNDQDFQKIVNSKEFQVKLVNDLTGNNYDNLDNVDTMYRENDDDDNEFDFAIEFDYKYIDNKIPVYMTVEGSHDFYEDASIVLFSTDGLKVDFSWIEKNDNLKKKLINSLVNKFNY